MLPLHPVVQRAKLFTSSQRSRSVFHDQGFTPKLSDLLHALNMSVARLCRKDPLRPSDFGQALAGLRLCCMLSVRFTPKLSDFNASFEHVSCTFVMQRSSEAI